MRISSVWATFIMIGCSGDPVNNNGSSEAGAIYQVECAVGGAKAFVTDCAFERGEGTVVTLRHRNGSFRKLIMENDGTIEPADGSENISVRTLNDGRTEIGIGEDSYRLPVAL